MRLPPGPIPLPFVGNILELRGTKQHFSIILEKFHLKYGDIFTFWPGPSPFIFICDADIGREVFSKSEFLGRPDSVLSDLLYSEDSLGVGLSNGPAWKSLRYICHSAITKYSGSSNLEYLVKDSVDKSFKKMIDNEGLNKAFNPFKYINEIYIDIMAVSTIGRGISNDLTEEETKDLNYILLDLMQEQTVNLNIMDNIPLLRRFFGFNKLKLNISKITKWIEKRFHEHYHDNNSNKIRDFCDALIVSKNEALIESKKSAIYLTDKNCAMSIMDLMFAATETTSSTTKWLLLLMLYYKDVESKLRQEIQSVIGDRMPTHEDRSKCHYVMAFISEVLRYRTVSPVGVYHIALCDSKIGPYNVTKGQKVFVFQSSIMKNKKYWEDPEQFNPDRFILNGTYSCHSKAYLPFGVGRRVCLGEKLAIANLFLVLVRFVQKLNEFNVELLSNYGLDIHPDHLFATTPYDYEIILN